MYGSQKKIWSLEMSPEIFHTPSPAISRCTWMGGGRGRGVSRVMSERIVTHRTRLSKGVGFFRTPRKALHHMLIRMQLASSGLTFEKGHQVSLSPAVCQDSRQRRLPIPSWRDPVGGWQRPEASSGWGIEDMCLITNTVVQPPGDRREGTPDAPFLLWLSKWDSSLITEPADG